MIAQLEPLTLVSDASGDASGTITNQIPGRVVAVKCVSNATGSDNFDLAIDGATSGLEILDDDTVTENTTVWWFPVIPAAVASSGAASALTELPPFAIEEDLNVVLANCGSGKTVTVTVYVDQGR
jgi:hypothetical protein